MEESKVTCRAEPPKSPGRLGEIKRYLSDQGVKFQTDETRPNTMRFRSYGQIYKIVCDGADFIFCCKHYANADLLIEAINTECRGRDGQF